jgi:nucleoside-diphosphate-sugar epimerase
VASEQLVRGYAGHYAFRGLNVRLSWVYGPRRTTDCIIRTMITDALAGTPTRLPFGSDFHRQFVHVDDAARALVCALDVPTPPRDLYTVTGGSRVTLGDIGRLVSTLLPGADISLGAGPDPLDDDQAEFDISPARVELGYEPSVPLAVGIQNYAQWLAQHNIPTQPSSTSGVSVTTSH